MIQQTKLDRFVSVYSEALTMSVTMFPEEYCWPVEQVPVVVERMTAAIVRGSFSHDGKAFRATCKTLGIKHTRKAIYAFLEGEST
ncbi:MAG: hypothetical protein WC551_09405 [Patescibacteria group bacterium]